jgi:hypothetical protein
VASNLPLISVFMYHTDYRTNGFVPTHDNYNPFYHQDEQQFQEAVDDFMDSDEIECQFRFLFAFDYCILDAVSSLVFFRLRLFV